MSGDGSFQCWVNNAGSASRDDVGPLIEIDGEAVGRSCRLNLKWTFFACQAAARVMSDGDQLSISLSAAPHNPIR